MRIGCARVSRYHHTSGRERGGREGEKKKKNPLPNPHRYLCCCKTVRKKCRGDALAAEELRRRLEGRAAPDPAAAAAPGHGRRGARPGAGPGRRRPAAAAMSNGEGGGTGGQRAAAARPRLPRPPSPPRPRAARPRRPPPRPPPLRPAPGSGKFGRA